MDFSCEHVLHVCLTGIGATVTMDLWALSIKRMFNIPSLNWAMVGRWLGGMASAKFRHSNIAEAPQIKGELFIGWAAHYMTGILFAATLVLIVGVDWLLQPTLTPALLFGLASVIFPFFLMQPGMGAGVAASKSPKPNQARFRSLLAHSVFGLGLYISAMLLVLLTRFQ